jgi:hypothetical protein
MQAIYVTVWNHGSTVIRTACTISQPVNLVENVVQSDVEIEGTLDEQYIELPDGTQVRNFVTDDGNTYEDGQLIDDGIEYADEEA